MRHNKDTLMQMLITLICIVLLLLIVLISPARAYEGDPVRTQRQNDLHDTAEALRAMGVPDSSPEIRQLQAEWWKEQEALNITAKVIQNEADPAWCEWEHSVAVGAVVQNRVKSDLFPNTTREVVAQPGQYLESYTRNFDGVSHLAYKAAKAALDGDHDVPEDAFWQDTHRQGKSVWKAFELDTGWYKSTTYICCGIPGVD